MAKQPSRKQESIWALSDLRALIRDWQPASDSEDHDTRWEIEDQIIALVVKRLPLSYIQERIEK